MASPCATSETKWSPHRDWPILSHRGQVVPEARQHVALARKPEGSQSAHRSEKAQLLLEPRSHELREAAAQQGVVP